MANLGTLPLHVFRGFARPTALGSIVRPFAGHVFRAYARHVPLAPSPQLADFAHFPVRLAGRACHFIPGDTAADAYPWNGARRPLDDANGRRYYYAHSIPIQWTAGQGARVITVHVRHTHAAGPTPRLRLVAEAGAGLPEMSVSAAATPNEDHALSLAFNLPTQATVIFYLENDNTAHGAYTTWGDIETA